MHLVNSTTDWLKRISGLSFALFFCSLTQAQENSPYSRYGLGDIVPNQNFVYRGMGGVSIADAGTFNTNFKNPASLGNISNARRTSMVFDVGGEIDIRTLRSTSTTSKYTSTNTLISYLQVAFPILPKKLGKVLLTDKTPKYGWGLSFGLRPLTRINYKIEQNERLSGIDSLNTLYEGSGGLNQFNISSGFRINRLTFGVSTGYTFGNKDFSTQLVFINDTVTYLKSNTQAKANFGGAFLNAGVQYQFRLQKDRDNNSAKVNVGAYANFRQEINAKQDKINETFAFDGTGSISTIDTVSFVKQQKGTVVIPATYGFGLNYEDKNRTWVTGIDFEFTQWKDYSYYKEKDLVQNSWVIRAGAQYDPATKSVSNKFWNFVTYRAGFYLGPDYVKLDKTRINYAATLGATFRLTTPRLLGSSVDEKQQVLLHFSAEYGGRGNKQSFSFRENSLRFGFGLSMNAKWFQKRSYY